MIYEFKFRPNKLGSPHVGRSQKTDKSQFYPTIDVSMGLEELDLLLAEGNTTKIEIAPTAR